jgi:DNA (cytosine-5)-methyltransferase 1
MQLSTSQLAKNPNLCPDEPIQVELRGQVGRILQRFTPRFHVLDAFAGAGGFSLGFDLAGHHIVGAIEIDKWACETFQYNHPDAAVMQSDISVLNDEKIMETFADSRPNVIVGGPPCQGYSICNKNAGDPKDPRNTLFQEFIRLGRLFEPDLMIMENVPNLLAAETSDKKPVISIIEQELVALGFHVYTKVLQATDYGIPQIRNRLFVVASRTPLECPFPTPTHQGQGVRDLFTSLLPQCPSLWDAISDLPPLAAREGMEEMLYTAPPQNNYQRLLRDNSERLYNHKAMNHGKRMVERFASMEWGHSGNDVPEHLKPRRRNSTEISTLAYDQNNRRMFPHRPCHTIPASFYANFVHPYQHRNFTAREGARIQSFPDWYRFLGKPTVVSHRLLAREERHDEKFLCQYNQIGNAVPPLLSKVVAENIFEQIVGSDVYLYTETT